jgi:hypothetical protein
MLYCADKYMLEQLQSCDKHLPIGEELFVINGASTSLCSQLRNATRAVFDYNDSTHSRPVQVDE